MDHIRADEVPMLLTAEQLGTLIHRRPASIKSDMVRAPSTLPPWMKLPGTRKPLWLRETVIDFITQNAKRANALPKVQLAAPKRGRRK